jgi:integrase
MASTEKYTDRSGKVLYAARWREGGQQRKERGFASDKKAQQFANAKEADARRGMTPTRSDVTVAEYARYWASTQDHRTTTKRRIESTIKTHIEGTALGKMKLAAVLPSQVQAWVTDRSKVVAPSTLRIGVVGLLKAVYTQAVHDNLVTKTPVVNLKLPKEPKDGERIVPLTVSQVEAMAEAMPERYAAAVITQAGLGLRLGELLGLRVQNVDFLRRRVSIEEQFIAKPLRDADGRKIRTKLKTDGSKRTLPLPQRVADVLAAHIAHYGLGEDGAIFTTRSGTPVGHQYYGFTLWNRAKEKAGLPEGATTHDLRHHFATALLHAPAEHRLTTHEVAALLGHEDASLVEKVYGHAPADANDRAMAAANAVWAV